MKSTSQNRTAIQKIIAVSAAVCILSFGLCSAGIFASLRSDLGFRWAPVVVGISSRAVVLSFILAVGLYVWDKFRSKRK